MRACEITYDYFDNADQERILRDIVEPLRFLLPEWLRNLSFAKVDVDERFALKCNVRREYRMAVISVRGAFFGQPKSALRLMVIHELIHLHHAFVNDFVRVRVQDFVQAHNSDLNTAMQSEYVDHLEGFIQDFAYIIDDLISNPGHVPTNPHRNFCYACMRPIDPSIDCILAPDGSRIHPECFTPINREKETP